MTGWRCEEIGARQVATAGHESVLIMGVIRGSFTVGWEQDVVPLRSRACKSEVRYAHRRPFASVHMPEAPLLARASLILMP